MIGTEIGPYRVGRELGTGGMGTVHAATVVRPTAGLPVGAAVALKVVHPHLLAEPGFRERFDREARIGLGVRHENVVRTLDFLEADVGGRRVPVVVLEFVEGRTLGALLAEMGRVPEELCRHLGREIALGLEAVHAAGVVHRDLKPGNVLLTPDHRVKVMDLGLARRAGGDDRVSTTGVFVGTAAYAPPEQFRGRQALDPRSDLYALGAMLYELSTGLLPFRAEALGDRVREVLHGTPERPGSLAPQLTPFFEEVVLTLLAKDPAQRFGSARELVGVLEAGEGGDWWASTSARLQAERQRPLRRVRVRRETDLWGREEDLAELRARWEEAKAGRGAAVLLEGEAGIGKTRLLEELLHGLDEEDAHLLAGRHGPAGAGGGEEALAAAFREHLAAEDLEAAVRERLTQAPLLAPAFAALLRGVAPPPGAEALAGEAAQAAFVHATRSLARERPLLLVVDDLHFAGEEGRGLFRAVALGAAGHRVLVLGTARPGLPARWIGDLTRAPHVERREVRRLDEAALGHALARHLGGGVAAETLAGRIAERAAGNPYFVVEMLRHLRESGRISRTGDGRWSIDRAGGEVEFPATVRELVATRLAGLPPEDRDLVAAAACQGFEFDGRLLAETLGRPPLDVLRRLGRLEHSTSLVRAAGARFVFDHHVVHEVVHGGLAKASRERHHGAIAECLEARHGAATGDPGRLDGPLLVALAEHLLEGGKGARALRYLGAGMDYLERGHLNEAAARLAESALAAPLLLAGAERARHLLRLCGVLDLLGRGDREAEASREAEDLAERAGDDSLRVRAAWALGRAHLRAWRCEAADAALSRALAVARVRGDRAGEAMVTASHGLVLELLGRVAEAREAFERANEAARGAGDRRAEASAVVSLARLLLQEGRLAEAEVRFRAGAAIFRELGDRQAEAGTVFNLGRVADAEGRLPEARSLYEASLALMREIGCRRGEAMNHAALGYAHHVEGRFHDARRCFERCLLVSREIGDREYEAYALGNLGGVLHAEGRLAEARAMHEQSLGPRREIGDRAGEAMALSNLSSIRRRCGDLAEARRLAEDAALAARAAPAPVLEGWALFRLGEVAAEGPSLDDALRAHEEAAAIRRRLGQPPELADSLLALAEVHHARGEHEAARAAAVEALGTAARSRWVGAGVLAACVAAWVGAGDAATAEDALNRQRERLDHFDHLRARYLLWRATGAAGHVAEARRLLEGAIAGAPPDARGPMVENVRVHREIAAATGPPAPSA